MTTVIRLCVFVTVGGLHWGGGGGGGGGGGDGHEICKIHSGLCEVKILDCCVKITAKILNLSTLLILQRRFGHHSVSDF